VTAVVDEDELRGVSEWCEGRLKKAVVRARPAVQAENRRPFAHGRPFGFQAHADDIEVKPDVSDAYSHAATLLPLALPTVRAS
jgi:hypothetical protein